MFGLLTRRASLCVSLPRRESVSMPPMIKAQNFLIGECSFIHDQDRAYFVHFEVKEHAFLLIIRHALDIVPYIYLLLFREVRRICGEQQDPVLRHEWNVRLREVIISCMTVNQEILSISRLILNRIKTESLHPLLT